MKSTVSNMRDVHADAKGETAFKDDKTERRDTDELARRKNTLLLGKSEE